MLFVIKRLSYYNKIIELMYNNYTLYYLLPMTILFTIFGPKYTFKHLAEFNKINFTFEV